MSENEFVGRHHAAFGLDTGEPNGVMQGGLVTENGGGLREGVGAEL